MRRTRISIAFGAGLYLCELYGTRGSDSAGLDPFARHGAVPPVQASHDLCEEHRVWGTGRAGLNPFAPHGVGGGVFDENGLRPAQRLLNQSMTISFERHAGQSDGLQFGVNSVTFSP